MNDNKSRILEVEVGKVLCLPKKREPVEKCIFCVHSKKIHEAGVWKISPARAYCVLNRSDDKVNIEKADAIECDDIKGEGYRSILNVIS
ncbi:MAG: hypothetical protein JW931_02840 [Methanomicrobiaceae archaeon]|nr:hypothetical protein [Methanomicrobiaceae archaeon]